MCLLCAPDCPVLKVKAKVNVSVPSDVINRPNSTGFNTKRVILLVISVARTRFDDSIKTDFKYLDFFVKYPHIIVFSIVPRKGVV